MGCAVTCEMVYFVIQVAIFATLTSSRGSSMWKQKHTAELFHADLTEKQGVSQ